MTPLVLVGRKAIAELLGVHPDTVRSLVEAGAPIRVVHDGHGARYLAEREALLDWVRGRSA